MGLPLSPPLRYLFILNFRYLYFLDTTDPALLIEVGFPKGASEGLVPLNWDRARQWLPHVIQLEITLCRSERGFSHLLEST